jgi:hypothetical protein
MQLALIIPIDIGSRPDQGLPVAPPIAGWGPGFPTNPIAPGGPGGQPPGFYPPVFPGNLPAFPGSPPSGGGSPPIAGWPQPPGFYPPGFPTHPIAPGGGAPVYPDQGLPVGGSPGIDNSLPVQFPRDGFILVYSPSYGWIFIPAGGPRPDQSLPGRQPGSGGKPDQSLPGTQPGVDNSLPGDQPRPDQGLPPHAQPKR